MVHIHVYRCQSCSFCHVMFWLHRSFNKTGCCLSTYAVFIILLILLELGCAVPPLYYLTKTRTMKSPLTKLETLI
ncbi:hypothetical protein BVRB_3g055880 [Beta vulgaris subsp. vulgaris]|uniref:Uncharacterized protein n=1 Tax=Beta vulgaris subsp. vulgaris TaxID=3555 RepID=A0A0J8FJ36_BETVV|nr:hypothetical protein BVRB_3g055880 [Beta vulgaris subsp. vulgaris]